MIDQAHAIESSWTTTAICLGLKAPIWHCADHPARFVRWATQVQLVADLSPYLGQHIDGVIRAEARKADALAQAE